MAAPAPAPATSSSSSSVPSLPPPSPKSPPGYPDLYGKRRETAKVQMLEREIGFLEAELKFVEGIQPASRCCKEVTDFVVANPDPFLSTSRKNRRSCRFWKWLCGMPCFNFSWICCCCYSDCSLQLELPRCCRCCECNVCDCCSCPSCSLPKWECCCSCPRPKFRCCKSTSCCCSRRGCCSRRDCCCVSQFPSCPDCSCCKWTCSCPKCPEVRLSCNCTKNRCNPCCLFF